MARVRTETVLHDSGTKYIVRSKSLSGALSRASIIVEVMDGRVKNFKYQALPTKRGKIKHFFTIEVS